jgi:Protein of unknown function (DUF2948)
LSEPLKLRARDADDLAVLSACLQDAILPISDVVWEHASRRFVIVANRFCWERVDDRHDAFDRVNCGVTFETVNAVKLRRIDRHDRGMMLSLLTIDLTPLPAGVAITLLCADNRDIRLEADALSVQLEDFDGPWPTRNRPAHLLDEPS